MDSWQFWIDTGGTFTDCLAIRPDGKLGRIKVLSSSVLKGELKEVSNKQATVDASWLARGSLFEGFTFKIPSHSFESAVVAHDANKIQLKHELPTAARGASFLITSGEEAPVLAARLLTQTALQDEFPPIKMRLGTTKGTNALLEHKGNAPLLVITEGFADLPLIGNQQRQNLFALDIKKLEPYHAEVFEIAERTDQKGAVDKPLAKQSTDKLKEYIQKNKTENAAVVCLNSYQNQNHEQEVKRAIARAGVKYITASAEISPHINFQERCETAIVNAYLMPVLDAYLSDIRSKVSQLQIMTSAGGLVNDQSFHPKDSLFSGPAGGVVAASAISRQTGIEKIITFDMGGTSTDVARYAQRYDYQYGSSIGDAHISGPALNIHTVAAGGGSICSFDGKKFTVGPESGGAQPGPASYGAGGPLCITDVNLLLGKMATDRFSIPLKADAAEDALESVLQNKSDDTPKEQVLQGFLDIANEKMAEAVRRISTARGFDPKEHALLAFGGAGGMHACAVADLLDVQQIILPKDAGILSAYGIGNALVERFASEEVLALLARISNLDERIQRLKEQALSALRKEGYREGELQVRHVFCYLRFRGQEHSLEIEWEKNADLESRFQEAYEKLYGHFIEGRELELASIKVVASVKPPEVEEARAPEKLHDAAIERHQDCWTGKSWEQVPVYDFERQQTGAVYEGPAIILYATSTAYLETGWRATQDEAGNLRARRREKNNQKVDQPEEIQLELFSNRFTGIAQEMGALLQRTAFSVNVKERLDFSCALLDADGDLIVNAPHIPVHLGALGKCVKQVVKKLALEEDDVAITNSPAYGGSHLPDVTLIAPIHFEGQLIGYAANRAHHAEIGGISPGSMPARAKNLAEEGVVIHPMKMVKKGDVQWGIIKQLLTTAKYPTRALEENLADLNAALASLQSGKNALQELFYAHGREKVGYYMRKLKAYSHQSLWRALGKFKPGEYKALEKLDDGNEIAVKINLGQDLVFDFTGTAPVHPGNFNANPAIVHSVILYVLRLIAAEEIPLNEGMLQAVKIHIPENTLLNPVFDDDPEKCPAVVGGNVELSQRLTDTLLKAFAMAACSQGTMNNVLFGNDNFGFYETICGGVGATENGPGANAVHQHMTNTRITDPEIMEFRYPVAVQKFAIRKNSGGHGKNRGGDGVVRELLFKEPVTLTVLTQHRKVAPYGMAGGEAGKCGKQYLIRSSGQEETLEYIDTAALEAGDKLVIETPGGGGYG